MHTVLLNQWALLVFVMKATPKGVAHALSLVCVGPFAHA